MPHRLTAAIALRVMCAMTCVRPPKPWGNAALAEGYSPRRSEDGVFTIEDRASVPISTLFSTACALRADGRAMAGFPMLFSTTRHTQTSNMRSRSGACRRAIG